MKSILFKELPLEQVFYTSPDMSKSEQWTRTDDRMPDFNARHPGTKASSGFPGYARFDENQEMWIDWLDEYFGDWRQLTPQEREESRKAHADKTRTFMAKASCVDPVHVDLTPGKGHKE
ncbi:MAG: hypothetical protein WA057_01475 [Candidatus Magasanikiibacteriota bacterium]